MSWFYSILIDLAVLGFFGFLYYMWQRRRIIKHSVFEIQNRLQDFLYDLHSYLEENKNKSFYSELDAFARSLELAANTNDLSAMKLALSKSPESMPSELSEDLERIEKLF